MVLLLFICVYSCVVVILMLMVHNVCLCLMSIICLLLSQPSQGVFICCSFLVQLYIYIYIYIYIYVHIHNVTMHICKHMYIHMCVYTYIREPGVVTERSLASKREQVLPWQPRSFSSHNQFEFAEFQIEGIESHIQIPGNYVPNHRKIHRSSRETYACEN